MLSFFLLLFGTLCGVIFKRALKSIFSIISAAGFRKNKNKKQNNTKKLTSGRSIELKFDIDAKLINLGFPRYKTHHKLDFRGKDKVSTVKSQTETYFGEKCRAT